MAKVYLAKLKRTKGSPKCVYKVGITNKVDVMSRLNYNGSDNSYPISKYFPDIKVMKSIVVKDMQEAANIESHIMETIARGGRFHNWYEEDHISGITEMRKWNYEEIQEIFKIMSDY